jgi:sec-independent protein translocase protein TatA
MPHIGPLELVVVLALALLILGPKRLPGAARSVGQGMREFREAITGSGRASGADDAPAIPPSGAAAQHEQRA